jgi:hypothetical protein
MKKFAGEIIPWNGNYEWDTKRPEQHDVAEKKAEHEALG